MTILKRELGIAVSLLVQVCGTHFYTICATVPLTVALVAQKKPCASATDKKINHAKS